MLTFRTALLWLHLVLGAVAGVVILVMSVTGVALTFEKQVLEWADRRQVPRVPRPAPAQPLPPETLLAAAAAARPGAALTGLTRRSALEAPATVTFDGGRALLMDPIRGVALGEPSPGLRAFFRTMTNWHRWLALEGASRATGRVVTGVANLCFLGLVVSGIYLWFPRVWTRLQFRQVLWFRSGLSAKARDFNWHHVIGVWLAVPLAIVVAGALPISFPWASTLVYRLAGDEPPPRAGGPPRPGAAPGVLARERPAPAPTARPLDVHGLDAAWRRAEAHQPDWRAISIRLAGPDDASYIFTIDSGYGGQPHKRGTLTLDRASASVVTWETFTDLSAGRQWRSWLRFAHTGEYYGLAGQTVAGLASAGGAVLVYTGLALAWRRWLSWIRRRAVRRPETKVA